MSVTEAHTLRRSSRVTIHVPIHVTSLQSSPQFSEVCETLVVNAHGCALRLPIPLNAGSALHLHSREGRQATAYVVACQRMGSEGGGWKLGARLDQPDNFWGLESCPDDWPVLEMAATAGQHIPERTLVEPRGLRKPQPATRPPQVILDKIEEQLSEARLRGIFAQFVQPLHAEVGELQERLARHARQNRFEVSLGHIPPQLEEKLWERLRQVLGTRVLEQTREQSAEILATTKTATEQKINTALAEFRYRLSGELQVVEKQAQALSKELTANARQQISTGIEKLQQQTLDAGAQLNAQGEKLSSSLEQRLVETHIVYRRESEQLHTAAAEKASQLESEVADLGRRIASLNESVRHLESDLDAHLERISGEIVSDARTQLGNAVGQALGDFQTRSSNEVESRIDEVCSHLRTIQNRIEHSFSGSLETLTDEAVQSVGQQIDELAQQFLERWRQALARDLNSVAKNLGQLVRQEFKSETSKNRVSTAG